MAKTRDGGGAVILQFPSDRREPSSIAAVARLAPSRSLVDSLLAEAGIAAHDAATGMARELAHQLRALEAGEGSDGAIIRLRRLVDAHVLHAMDLCREYQAAGDRLISLEVQGAQADRLTGTLQAALHAARADLRGRAIAARAAADAVEGAAKALVSYIRGVAESSVPDAAEPEQLLLFATAG
jgi:hypothetical protein